jgi:hypothetical protein
LPTTNQTYDDKQRHRGTYCRARVYVRRAVIVGMAVMVVMIIAQEKRAEQIDT